MIHSFFLDEERKDTSNSAKVIIWQKDMITNKPSFLICRNGNGEWNLPGGHIKDDEDMYEGLIREVSEEISVKLKKNNIKKIKTLDRTNGKGKIYLFKAEYITPEVPVRAVQIKPDSGFKYPEVMEIRWIKSKKDLGVLDFVEKNEYAREAIFELL